MGFNPEYNKRRPESTHVAVLMGGWSKERDVSIATGRACTKALEEAGFKVTQIDVKPDICQVLNEMRPDVAFNALHGKWGEDGTVQGILETLKIPYTHSGVLASSLAMDKHKCKGIFKEAGVPVADSRVVPIEEAAEIHKMLRPYVIKPVAEGSSFGVQVVTRGMKEPLQELLEQRDVYGEFVMIERYVQGKELTCAVMHDVALGVTEIEPVNGFYDYKAKYEEGASRHILPAEIPNDIYRKIQQYSLAAHTALGCRGVSRADFRFDDSAGSDGELICLEVNTQPGMTPTSLVPELAEHSGHSFAELANWMVQDASLDR